MANPISWGTITLTLDHDVFRRMYERGRSVYFDMVEHEHPEHLSTMTSLDLINLVADGKEVDGVEGDPFRFDCIAFPGGPPEILGFFLGYMSGPLSKETAEERLEREARYIFHAQELLIG